MDRSDVAARVGLLYKEEAGRILATLLRSVRDLDVAEEALQEAFAAAVAQWPDEGVPDTPRAWVLRAARNKAIDRLRRRAKLEDPTGDLDALAEAAGASPDAPDDAVPDDLLRLVFTCCHPALAPEAQVALTLRSVCGLETEAIAHAFLVPGATMSQRLVRAKRKIAEARIPYRIPDADELDERIDGALATVYLVFNEGYASTSGDAHVRADLCAEAVRLGRVLCELLPDWPEPRGLLALMLLHDARRATRVDAAGDLVLLDEQDRSRWDAARIGEGLSLVEEALKLRPISRYALEAAIAALHAKAPRAEATDWPQIAALYGVLIRLFPSPVVELNAAVAVAMVDGPDRGLALLDALDARGELAGYHHLPAARADLLRRLGRRDEAAAAYKSALTLVSSAAERRFLEKRLALGRVQVRTRHIRAKRS